MCLAPCGAAHSGGLSTPVKIIYGTVAECGGSALEAEGETFPMSVLAGHWVLRGSHMLAEAAGPRSIRHGLHLLGVCSRKTGLDTVLLGRTAEPPINQVTGCSRLGIWA